MIPAPRGPSRLPLLVAAGMLVSGCATSFPQVDPADIPRLEQAVAASPDDTKLQVQLGIARFQSGAYEAARDMLSGAVEAGDQSGPAFLYLGMAEEELENWSGARTAYNRYLVVGESSEGRREVRKRLTLIGRNILRAQAQQALAREAEITSTGATTPRSVAVMPLAFNSENMDLEPLIYALSDMMITDFKVSNALIVLERTQVQTLLDEMALTSAGYADAATGARAGRLLRAEHVLQGVLTTLGDNDLQTDADILNVPRNDSEGQLTESAALEQLFDMEKAIVIRTIREVLGVELTPAEEQAILENRMQNVLAFLAYGRGLRELDQGNYDAAQAEFEAAAALEPGSFASLELALAETAALTDATTTTTADLAGLASATGELGRGLFEPPAANTTEDLSTLGIPSPVPLGAAATDDDPATGGTTTTTTTGGAPTTGGGDPTTTGPGGTTTTTGVGGTTTIGGVGGTLTGLAEGVDPTATTSTIDLGSAGQTRDPTSTQSQPTTREPVQEVTGTEGTAPSLSQIRLIIRRPGGDS